MLMVELIQGFPWSPQEQGRKIVPCLKLGTCRANSGLELGLQGELQLQILGGNSSHPRAVIITPEISCLPFVQHHLISPLLTSSHCMIAFCRHCPISHLELVHKMLYFLISLLSIRQPVQHLPTLACLSFSLSSHLPAI